MPCDDGSIICDGCANNELKSVLPEYKVPPDNVVAEKLNALDATPEPDKTTPVRFGEAANINVGFISVPPVVILEFCEPTLVTPTLPTCANNVVTSVEPEYKVPPLNVVAEKLNALDATPEPDKIIPLNEGESTTLNIGADAVPPV